MSTQKRDISVENLSKKFLEEKKKYSNIKTGDVVYKELEKWKKMHEQVEKEKKALEEENKQIKCKIDEQGDQANLVILSSSKSHMQIKSDFETLKKRFAQMDLKNTKLRARNTLLEREKDDIKLELQNIKSEVSNLNIEITKLKGLNNTLRSKLKTTNTEELKKQLEESQAKVNVLNLENSELKNDNDDLKIKLETLNRDALKNMENKIESLTSEITEYQKRILEIENKNTTLKKQSENIIKENDKTLQNLQQFQDEINQYKSKIQSKDEDYKKLQTELSSVLKSSQIGCQCASEVQKENTNLKQSIYQMQTELETTKKDLEKALNRAIATSKYQVDNEQLVAQLSEQFEEIRLLKDNVLTNELLKQDNLQLQAQLNNLNTDLEILRQKNQQLEMYQNQMDIMKDSECKFKQKISYLECENNKLLSDLNQLKNDNQKEPQFNKNLHTKLTKRIYTMEQESDKLRKDLNFALDEIKHKSTELTKTQCSDANNKQKIIDLTQEIKILNNELQCSTTKEEKATKLLTEYKIRSNTLKTKLQYLESEKLKLKKQLDETLADLSEKSEQLNNSYKNYQELQLQNEVLVQQLENLPKSNIDYLKNTIYDLQAEKNRLENAFKDINSEYEKLKSIQSQDDTNIQQTIGQLELENENLRNKIEELMSSGDNAMEVQNLSKEYKKLQNKVEKLEEEKENLQEENSRLQYKKTSESNVLFKQRLAQLEDENVKLKTELDKMYRELKNTSYINEESSKLKRRIYILESEIENQKKHYSAALAQSKEMMQLSSILKEKVRSMEIENHQLKNTKNPALQEYQQRIKNLEKQLQLSTNQIEEFQKKCNFGNTVMQENKKLRKKVRDMEVDIELLKRELGGAINDMHTSQKNNEDLVNDCVALKNKVASLESQRDKLKKKCCVKFSE